MKDLLMKLMSLRNGLTQKHYSGHRAEKYETGRSKSDRWKFEEESFLGFFSDICRERTGLVVIDVPVGTNRFHDYIDGSEAVEMAYGIDFSDDMLCQAQKKNTKKYKYLKHDVLDRNIPVLGDVVFCFRFLNLFSSDEAEVIMNRISAACRGDVVFSVRLVEDDRAGRTLEGGKVHLHTRGTFMLAVERAGLELVKSREFRDHKPGIYYVMWARKISPDLSEPLGER